MPRRKKPQPKPRVVRAFFGADALAPDAAVKSASPSNIIFERWRRAQQARSEAQKLRATAGELIETLQRDAASAEAWQEVEGLPAMQRAFDSLSESHARITHVDAQLVEEAAPFLQLIEEFKQAADSREQLAADLEDLASTEINRWYEAFWAALNHGAARGASKKSQAAATLDTVTALRDQLRADRKRASAKAIAKAWTDTFDTEPPSDKTISSYLTKINRLG